MGIFKNAALPPTKPQATELQFPAPVANDGFPFWQPLTPQDTVSFSRVPVMIEDLRVNQIPQFNSQDINNVMTMTPGVPMPDGNLFPPARGEIVSSNWAYYAMMQSLTPEEQFNLIMNPPTNPNPNFPGG